MNETGLFFKYIKIYKKKKMLAFKHYKYYFGGKYNKISYFNGLFKYDCEKQYNVLSKITRVTNAK